MRAAPRQQLTRNPTLLEGSRYSTFYFGDLKAMGATAESPPVALPTLTAQAFKLAFVVPHFPLPIFPSDTTKVCRGSRPVLVMVIGVGIPLTAQFASPFAFTRHSTIKTVSPGLKPLPATLTFWPLRRLVEGVTTIFGLAAADALVTPMTLRDSPLSPTTATLIATRSPLVVNIFPPGISRFSLRDIPHSTSRSDGVQTKPHTHFIFIVAR
jgi:hypothetical protein